MFLKPKNAKLTSFPLIFDVLAWDKNLKNQIFTKIFLAKSDFWQAANNSTSLHNKYRNVPLFLLAANIQQNPYSCKEKSNGRRPKKKIMIFSQKSKILCCWDLFVISFQKGVTNFGMQESGTAEGRKNRFFFQLLAFLAHLYFRRVFSLYSPWGGVEERGWGGRPCRDKTGEKFPFSPRPPGDDPHHPPRVPPYLKAYPNTRLHEASSFLCEAKSKGIGWMYEQKALCLHVFWSITFCSSRNFLTKITS